VGGGAVRALNNRPVDHLLERTAALDWDLDWDLAGRAARLLGERLFVARQAEGVVAGRRLTGLPKQTATRPTDEEIVQLPDRKPARDLAQALEIRHLDAGAVVVRAGLGQGRRYRRQRGGMAVLRSLRIESGMHSSWTVTRSLMSRSIYSTARLVPSNKNAELACRPHHPHSR